MEKGIILANLIPIKYRFSYIKDDELKESVDQII